MKNKKLSPTPKFLSLVTLLFFHIHFNSISRIYKIQSCKALSHVIIRIIKNIFLKIWSDCIKSTNVKIMELLLTQSAIYRSENIQMIIE